jgi:hypothetical protein
MITRSIEFARIDRNGFDRLEPIEPLADGYGVGREIPKLIVNLTLRPSLQVRSDKRRHDCLGRGTTFLLP